MKVFVFTCILAIATALPYDKLQRLQKFRSDINMCLENHHSEIIDAGVVSCVLYYNDLISETGDIKYNDVLWYMSYFITDPQRLSVTQDIFAQCHNIVQQYQADPSFKNFKFINCIQSIFQFINHLSDE